MLQPAFNIGDISQAADAQGSCLLLEISAQSLNYILYSKDPFGLLLLRQYRLYTSADRSLADLIGEVIEGDEWISQHSDNAIVVYNFPEATIVPAAYYNSGSNVPVSRLMFGDDSSGSIFGEPVKDLDLYNIYRVPQDIHSLLKEKFRGSQYWHIYTLLLLSPHIAAPSKENVIRTVFYHDHFIAAYFQADRLQLIQTFNYQTPEDAAYYLLLICKQFNVPQQEMALTVSGLIDTQSALYTELLKYFTEVSEEGVPSDIVINNLPEEFPQHYFSPLLKMPLCGL